MIDPADGKNTVLLCDRIISKVKNIRPAVYAAGWVFYNINAKKELNYG